MGHLHMRVPKVRTVAVPGLSIGWLTIGFATTGTKAVWGEPLNEGDETGLAMGCSVRRGAIRFDGVRLGAVAAMRGGRLGLYKGRVGEDGAALPDKPNLCTLPITALRVTPPNCLAICEAEWPSCQSFFSVSTRSSFQLILPVSLIYSLS
jgi:hypothetical protein